MAHAGDVEPHLGCLASSWGASAEEATAWSPGWLRQHHPEWVGTVEQIRAVCVEILMSGIDPSYNADIYLRHHEGGGIGWNMGGHLTSRMTCGEADVVPTALAQAAAVIERRLARHR